LALAFVDCINLRDLPGLVSLMSADHRLQVFDEAPLVGRADNEHAWRGYFDAFPSYLIYPHRIAENAHGIAILGHTTGSHPGLTDAEESELTLIWVATTNAGAVTSWTLLEDTPTNRRELMLDVR
jgi:SnoaL-like domain